MPTGSGNVSLPQPESSASVDTPTSASEVSPKSNPSVAPDIALSVDQDASSDAARDIIPAHLESGVSNASDSLANAAQATGIKVLLQTLPHELPKEEQLHRVREALYPVKSHLLRL